jgi:hypothetical protein
MSFGSLHKGRAENPVQKKKMKEKKQKEMGQKINAQSNNSHLLTKR